MLVEDVIYLWGGVDYHSYHCCNELHAFDVDTHRWSKPSVSGTVPEAREEHSACVLDKVMFIYGGSGLTDDINKLDTTTMVWSVINTRGTQPPAALDHSATIIGTKMFVFGAWSWITVEVPPAL